MKQRLRRNIYDSTQDAFTLRSDDITKNNALTGLKQLYCNITGNEITETRYHNLKVKQNISTKAFEDGHFPAAFKSADFVKLDKTYVSSDAKPWSDQEVLLLLEAIEMFGEDWNAICGHVGSRTKEQCISKFIQLPIEDQYLEKQLDKKDLLNVLSQKDKKDEFSKLKKKLTEKLSQSESELNSVVETAHEKIETEATKESQLLDSILALSLKKFELKFNELKKFEELLLKERKQLAAEKHTLLLDRLALRKQAQTVRSKLIKASELGASDEGLQYCEEANFEANKAPRIITNQKSELTKLETEI
ncbi:unnamed protein product [Ambrosiozyma monospora]|uniref:Unnamed protein product n=1 Tax=Ambrosiozyma monospora TaxID=43982 RepID=A0ACB5TT01_AMBMO|nr:unnamed protein product [Ambrosiozyma monospora]